MLELGSWKSEVGNRKSEVGSGKSEGEGLEEVKYGTRGRVGRGRGDVKCRDARDAGYE